MCQQKPPKYHVSVVDVNLPPLRVRMFYPTAVAASASQSAPFFPRSDSFPNDTVTSVIRYAKIPFSSLLAIPLHFVANKPLEAAYGAPLIPSKELQQLPVHMFSHGLGGSIGGYNHVCIEMASHGNVVFAPEHSDGSAFQAHVDGRVLEFIPYNPLKHGPSDINYRQSQLNTRVEDLIQLVRNIRAVNESRLQLKPLSKAPQPPNFTNRLDVNALHVSGHSFGGATAIAFADKVPVKSVICLDAWLRALSPRIEQLNVGSAKLLFVDQGMSNMSDSISARERLPSMSGSSICDAVVIQEGHHNNSSDFALRIPKFITVAVGITKRNSDPLKLLNLQAHVVRQFLEGDWTKFRKRVADGAVDGIGLAPLGRARVIKRHNEVERVDHRVQRQAQDSQR